MLVTLRDRRRRWIAHACAVAALSVLTACSYHQHGTGAPGGFVAVPSDGRSVGDAAPSEADLNSVILRDGDLPATFVAVPETISGSDAGPDSFTIPACDGMSATTGDILDSAFSSEYIDGAAVIFSRASSYRSPVDIKTDSTYIVGPQFVQCTQTETSKKIAAGLPAGQKLTSLKATVSGGGTPANLVAIVHSTITITATTAVGSTKVPVYEDDAFVVGPQLEVLVEFSEARTPVAPSFESQIIKLIASRADIA